MITKQDIVNINQLYTDFRSDVIAAGLVEQGFDIDRILMLRKSTDANGTGKEIESMEIRPDFETGEDTLRISTNRRGIYDKIPESLFHPPSFSPKNTGKESILEEIRRHREEEFFIRRFFSLFEAETERARIEIQLTELRYDKPENHRTFVDTMLPYWPVIRLMDLRTAILFVRTVPYIVKLRNSYRWSADAMTAILGQQVSIKLRSSSRVRPKIRFPRLGNMKLGVNFVLRGDFIDTDPTAEICVYPSVSMIKDFLPKSIGYRIVEALADLLLPTLSNREIIILGKEDEKTSRLRDANTPCYLGINFRLGKLY